MKKEKNVDVLKDFAKLEHGYKDAEKESGEMLEEPEKVKEKLDAAMEFINKFGGGSFLVMLEDFTLLVEIVSAYIKKEYRQIPYRSIVAMFAAIIYVVNPLDVIPDAIPGIGLLDDALVVSLVVKTVHEDLQDYKKWKESKI